MTREQLQAHRDSLKQALYSGELSVRDSDGKQIQYRSVAELKAALADLERELAALDNRRRPRGFRIRTVKGV